MGQWSAKTLTVGKAAAAIRRKPTTAGPVVYVPVRAFAGLQFRRVLSLIMTASLTPGCGSALRIRWP